MREVGGHTDARQRFGSGDWGGVPGTQHRQESSPGHTASAAVSGGVRGARAWPASECQPADDPLARALRRSTRREATHTLTHRQPHPQTSLAARTRSDPLSRSLARSPTTGPQHGRPRQRRARHARDRRTRTHHAQPHVARARARPARALADTPGTSARCQRPHRSTHRTRARDLGVDAQGHARRGQGPTRAGALPSLCPSRGLAGPPPLTSRRCSPSSTGPPLTLRNRQS